MNGSINTISLDLHRSEAPRAIFVKKGDTVRGISAALVEDGKEYKTTSDCSAVLSAILPDGSAARTNMEIYQHRLHATIPAEWTENAGVIRCEVTLFGASPAIRLTSPMFSVVVVETLTAPDDVLFAYWDKATAPMASSSRKIPITDANFDCRITSDTNSYGWILIPKSLYPAPGQRYLALIMKIQSVCTRHDNTRGGVKGLRDQDPPV